MPLIAFWHGNFLVELMNEAHNDKPLLDIRQLRAFSTLAKTGSFTRAGRDLCLSQSAVSHSIKGLESDTGCRLFDRVGKRVQLTPAGEHLLHHAEKVLQELTLARTSLEQRVAWGKARLRVGASAAICQHLLPAVLHEFTRQFQDYGVTVLSADTAQAVEAIQNGRMDLAIGLTPPRDAGVDFVPLFTDELAFITAPTHAWAQQGRAMSHAIAAENLILYSKSSQTFRLIDGYFRRLGVSLNLFVELESMEAIKEFVKLGLGVSILAPWVAEKESQEGSLAVLPLDQRKLRRTWGVLRPSGKSSALGAEAFIELCRHAGERMVPA